MAREKGCGARGDEAGAPARVEGGESCRDRAAVSGGRPAASDPTVAAPGGGAATAGAAPGAATPAPATAIGGGGRVALRGVGLVADGFEYDVQPDRLSERGDQAGGVVEGVE